MAKFTFINDDSDYEGDSNYPNAKTTVEFESVYLQAVVNQFEMFLKGSGFVFDSLEIVSDTSLYDPYDSEEDHGSNIPESHIEEVVTGVAKYPWEGTGTTKSFWNMEFPPITTANIQLLTTKDISAFSSYSQSLSSYNIPSLTTANLSGLTSYSFPVINTDNISALTTNNLSTLTTDQLKSSSFYDYDRNK